MSPRYGTHGCELLHFLTGNLYYLLSTLLKSGIGDVLIRRTALGLQVRMFITQYSFKANFSTGPSDCCYSILANRQFKRQITSHTTTQAATQLVSRDTTMKKAKLADQANTFIARNSST